MVLAVRNNSGRIYSDYWRLKRVGRLHQCRRRKRNKLTIRILGLLPYWLIVYLVYYYAWLSGRNVKRPAEKCFIDGWKCFGCTNKIRLTSFKNFSNTTRTLAYWRPCFSAIVFPCMLRTGTRNKTADALYRPGTGGKDSAYQYESRSSHYKCWPVWE